MYNNLLLITETIESLVKIHGQQKQPRRLPIPNPVISLDSYKRIDGGNSAGKPGEDFNTKATHQDVLTKLQQHEWKVFKLLSNRTYMTRPGKDVRDGNSATLFHTPPILYVHSSKAAPFEAKNSYSAFAVWAALDHGGDFSATARALHQQGYGDQKKNGNGRAATVELPQASPFSPANALAETPQPKQIEVIDAGDWLENEPPAPDQILADMLDAGDKMAVLASSKQRKSFFLLQMALSLATGHSFLNWNVPHPRRVLYVQFEIRKTHCHKRTRYLTRGMGIRKSDLDRRLKVISARGLGLSGIAGLEQIRQAAADFSPEVIMLDPLYKIAEGMENAAEDFKKLLDAFDHLAEQTGAAIIYVHHDAKGSPGDRDIRDRGAGSSVLGRDYDACITLTPHKAKNDVAVVETLLRNYASQEPFSIRWTCGAEAYCFVLAEEIAPEKRTGRRQPQVLPFGFYLPVAKALLVAGNEMQIGKFKEQFKERTGFSEFRVREFINWATEGNHPRLNIKEKRGKGIHIKTLSLSEDILDG